MNDQVVHTPAANLELVAETWQQRHGPLVLRQPDPTAYHHRQPHWFSLTDQAVHSAPSEYEQSCRERSVEATTPTHIGTKKFSNLCSF